MRKCQRRPRRERKEGTEVEKHKNEVDGEGSRIKSRSLEVELLGLFPGERGLTEVTVHCGNLVLSFLKVELLDDDSPTKIPVCEN